MSAVGPIMLPPVAALRGALAAASHYTPSHGMVCRDGPPDFTLPVTQTVGATWPAATTPLLRVRAHGETPPVWLGVLVATMPFPAPDAVAALPCLPALHAAAQQGLLAAVAAPAAQRVACLLRPFHAQLRRFADDAAAWAGAAAAPTPPAKPPVLLLLQWYAVLRDVADAVAQNQQEAAAVAAPLEALVRQLPATPALPTAADLAEEAHEMVLTAMAAAGRNEPHTALPLQRLPLDPAQPPQRLHMQLQLAPAPEDLPTGGQDGGRLLDASTVPPEARQVLLVFHFEPLEAEAGPKPEAEPVVAAAEPTEPADAAVDAATSAAAAAVEAEAENVAAVPAVKSKPEPAAAATTTEPEPAAGAARDHREDRRANAARRRVPRRERDKMVAAALTIQTCRGVGLHADGSGERLVLLMATVPATTPIAGLTWLAEKMLTVLRAVYHQLSTAGQPLPDVCAALAQQDPEFAQFAQDPARAVRMAEAIAASVAGGRGGSRKHTVIGDELNPMEARGTEAVGGGSVRVRA